MPYLWHVGFFLKADKESRFIREDAACDCVYRSMRVLHGVVNGATTISWFLVERAAECGRTNSTRRQAAIRAR